jgi:hypothetical protein
MSERVAGWIIFLFALAVIVETAVERAIGLFGSI